MVVIGQRDRTGVERTEHHIRVTSMTLATFIGGAAVHLSPRLGLDTGGVVLALFLVFVVRALALVARLMWRSGD
jgi:hypothetical protein